jgi:hypothetical protein
VEAHTPYSHHTHTPAPTACTRAAAGQRRRAAPPRRGRRPPRAAPHAPPPRRAPPPHAAGRRSRRARRARRRPRPPATPPPAPACAPCVRATRRAVGWCRSQPGGRAQPHSAHVRSWHTPLPRALASNTHPFPSACPPANAQQPRPPLHVCPPVEVFKGKDAGVVARQALPGVPGRGTEALEAAVPLEALARGHTLWGVHLQAARKEIMQSECVREGRGMWRAGRGKGAWRRGSRDWRSREQRDAGAGRKATHQSVFHLPPPPTVLHPRHTSRCKQDLQHAAPATGATCACTPTPARQPGQAPIPPHRVSNAAAARLIGELLVILLLPPPLLQRRRHARQPLLLPLLVLRASGRGGVGWAAPDGARQRCGKGLGDGP